jgi:Gram-negative bacterial TonB protein C-terminal
MKNAFLKDSLRYFLQSFILLFVCLSFFQSPLKAQESTKNWYCDERLKLFSNLRRGTVEYIENNDSVENDQLSAYISRNFQSKAFINVRMKLEDLRTGESLNEIRQYLIFTGKESSSPKLKTGESYLFEADWFGLGQTDKGGYKHRFHYVLPNGYFKNANSAQADIEFFKSASKLNAISDILGLAKEDKVVSAGAVNGKALSLVRPLYPESLRKSKIGGQLNVAVLISEDGNVIRAKAYCSKNEDLAKYAEHAALTSKFSSTKLNGNAVKASGILIYSFSPR